MNFKNDNNKLISIKKQPRSLVFTEVYIYKEMFFSRTEKMNNIIFNKKTRNIF